MQIIRKGATIETCGRVYSASKAVDVAKLLQTSDPEWKYEAELDARKQFGRVKVFDAEGNFVGYF